MDRAGIGHLTRQEGFTLIELLVVLLIIGLLAAIALPSFLRQRDKAFDAEAKTNVRTASLAIETYATEHHGYGGAQPSDLREIEPTLADSPSLTVDSAAGDSFKIHVDSAGNPPITYWIERTVGGTVLRTCSDPNRGGCDSGGVW